MNQLITFILLGLGVGALYGFAAQGLVVIYRGSGVLNLAAGAVGVAAAYLQWELLNTLELPFVVSSAVAVLVAALLGAVVHLGVMRRLRASSALVRIVATLAVLILLQGLAIERYGDNVLVVDSTLPQDIWRITDDIFITSDRVYLLGIGALISAVLWAVYRFTSFGLSTSAVAENQRSASSLGLSPDSIAAINWALGCALAATGAILMAPVTGLSVDAMTRLLLATVAAALIGNFASFGLTLLGGLAIGVASTVLGYYANGWGTAGIGIPDSVPFFTIVLLLVVRGRALPLRDYFQQRLPEVGTGRIRPGVLLITVGVMLFVISQVGAAWSDAFTTTFTAALVMLSIVVVAGYAGQISLGQFALAGFGGWVAARLVDVGGFPFWAALAIGVVATVPLGLLFALPAVRTRGINLAIVTLGLGTAIEVILWANGDYTGGAEGTTIGFPTIFGIEIDATTHPQRYAAICFVAFILCALMVSNVRRGRTGRRLLAVRTNERAAAALGISVVQAKLYAFCLAAGIAAFGGILMFFRSSAVVFDNLTNFTSILYIGFAVIGGIGFLRGPVVGGLFVVGGVGAHFGDVVWGEQFSNWLHVFSGAFLLMIILQNPNGLVKAEQEMGHDAWAKLRRIPGLAVLERLYLPLLGRKHQTVADHAERERVTPRTLEISDVTVRYGAVVACKDISLTLEPGRITGLIGPNGAGKTTLVDAITGFTSPSSGDLRLDGESVTTWSAACRARAGMSRSFQSLELFEDMTVYENLRTASDPHDLGSYVTGLFWASNPPLPAQVQAAIREFGLSDDLERKVEDLPYGKRRLLAIARAVASGPSVILLDEPAAGLTEVETRELSHLVRRLADDWGMAVLLIEHDVNFVMSVCDHVVVLDFGERISEGTPDVVRRDERVIAAYLGGAAHSAGRDGDSGSPVKVDDDHKPELADVTARPSGSA